jgi:hypothetical protein
MLPRALWCHGLFIGAALSVALGACDDDHGSCPACETPAQMGALENADIAEASGVAASAVHPDVYYTHNDAGDSSRFFALSGTGAHLATFKVKKAKNDDWEDISVGPCDAGSCVFIADIGDNSEERTGYTLYRLAEPPAMAPAEQSLPADELVFTYEDGPHNAEVLLVHPETGVVTIVTKEKSGPSAIFELPLPLQPGKPHIALLRGTVEPPGGSNEFTGGAVHPQGTGVLLRTATDLFFYSMQPGQSVADALAGAGCSLRAADEEQGEAVTWLRSGAGYVTIGENVGAPVNMSQCAAN